MTPFGHVECDDGVRFRLKRLDDQIRVEFDLISHRMTWLVISHSFMFSAFTIAATSPAPALPMVAGDIRFLLPLLGGITAIIAGLALLAAHQVISLLKTQRDIIEEQAHKSCSYERLGVAAWSWPHALGNLPSHSVPWLLLGVWGYLLYGVISA